MQLEPSAVFDGGLVRTGAQGDGQRGKPALGEAAREIARLELEPATGGAQALAEDADANAQNPSASPA